MALNPLRSREPVEITERRAPTKAEKTAAWNRVNGLCWWCGKPVAAGGLGVDWDHDMPRGLTGDDSAENLAPLHSKCHDAKTFGKTGDIATVAHAKRQEKLTRPKEHKRSGFNQWRKFDGTIVRRGQS